MAGPRGIHKGEGEENRSIIFAALMTEVGWGVEAQQLDLKLCMLRSN